MRKYEKTDPQQAYENKLRNEYYAEINGPIIKPEPPPQIIDDEPDDPPPSRRRQSHPNIKSAFDDLPPDMVAAHAVLKVQLDLTRRGLTCYVSSRPQDVGQLLVRVPVPPDYSYRYLALKVLTGYRVSAKTIHGRKHNGKSDILARVIGDTEIIYTPAIEEIIG